jgi:nucleoside-diphosphate-sugar epimerase
MHVFVTGASGFVGSAVVQELLKAGHRVLGLARSENSAKALIAMGAEVLQGDVNDHEILKQGVAASDAVIHTAFNHDFSKFKANCEDDRQVILALGAALAGTGKPVVITSGIGLIRKATLITEDDVAPSADVMPRGATEEATRAIAAQGVDAYVVRLPPTVHGKGDHGFVPMIIGMSKEKGESAYINEGNNHWPAVHRFDAAKIYRLAIEQRPSQKVFHAVAESGIAFRKIAEAIGKGLNVPVVNKNGAEAEKHFTWFLHFASMDCEASSELTQKTLGWKAKCETLIEDLSSVYF